MRNFVIALLGLGPSLALSACAGGYDIAHPNVLGNVQAEANWQAFQYCGGWGCSDPHESLFSAEEWARVEAVMTPAATTPLVERQKIAVAVGLMEALIGPKTGYDQDRAGTGAGLFQFGQLDCYSEAANTSNFLHILENAGLLRHHTSANPIMRGQATGLSLRPTHATAVIIEDATGTSIAMDSWFFENGHSAVFVDVDTWADSWAPEDGAMF